MSLIDDIEKTTFLNAFNVMKKTHETNDRYVLANLLVDMEFLYPKQAQNILDIIFLKNEDKYVYETFCDVVKCIRQTSDYKEDRIFYTILNSNFGERVIKLLRIIENSNQELFAPSISK